MVFKFIPILLILGECLSESPLSREEWERRLDSQGPLAKRGYILHNMENGNPRYTTLVRRNYLRFGKRSDPGLLVAEEGTNDIEPKEDQDDIEKRTRNFIRFGKRGVEEEVDPVYRNRRVSNYLRFGRSQPNTPRCEDVYTDEMCDQMEMELSKRRVQQYLRFGR